MSDRVLPKIAILGAAGLIGSHVAFDLRRDGFPVLLVARRFTTAQKALFAESCLECQIASLDTGLLSHLLTDQKVEVVVNCLGVLQDGPGGRTDEVHRGFVARLVAAMGQSNGRRLLIHLSIPGLDTEDSTAFSRTKREADRIIARSSLPFVILRPGFVVAPAAFGGSALIRALATLPFALPAEAGSRPFAATDVTDIARTIAIVARQAAAAEAPRMGVIWDVLERNPRAVEGVVDAFRRRLGARPPSLRLPAWAMRVGALAGDICGRLGWVPPIRSTALSEMLRGITGDPRPWSVATAIEPASLDAILAGMPASVQEIWFARLYLIKPLILGTLVMFWILTGLIALTVGREAGIALFSSHGVPFDLAHAVTVAASFGDIGIGAAIAVRRTCAAALLTGIALSLCYLICGTILTPDLWTDPTGPLLKAAPAIVLMLVALVILPNR